ncbi:autophagy protein 5 [Lycorma delicatula]|uniref:autophagy protein 5 n=1 Tax=Lycorma delicatula TaxID=130591 RepID=UPI003F512FD8
MASDREILREIWEGKLPVCFILNSEEVIDLPSPEPYYLMVPRLNYFPLVTEKVRKHFLRYVHQDKHEAEMWLEFNGLPIKWHYPIGVIFDINKADIELPWNITVHFDKFPEHEILHCSNREVVESHFMSCIKEAGVLKHRSQIVSSMQKKDHNQLWLGLQNNKFDQFWAVNRKLMEVGQGGEDTFKYIPFRCHHGDKPMIQRLVRPVTEEGHRKTLLHLLQEVYPNEYQNLKVIMHGVEPPRETPLQWMSEHLSYPDNFLHLSITMQQSS